MGTLADRSGRRPVYILCFIIYIFANASLALSRSFPALLVLRAVQSCGSSGTVALASAVAADIITSSERGMYMGIASLGNILAPSLGPIVGGAISERLGWRAVFVFLGVMAALFLGLFLVVFPETCRRIVRDGSYAAILHGRRKGILRWWNLSAIDYYREVRIRGGSEDVDNEFEDDINDRLDVSPRINPFSILLERPTGLLLLANGIIFASYYSVTSGMPVLFHQIYNIGDLGIGLIFIPAGIGSLCSAIFNGTLVDWNYRRLKARFIRLNQLDQETIRPTPVPRFRVEKARLQIALPMTLAAAISVTTYGFLIEPSRLPPLLLSLFMVLMVTFCITAAYNVMNVLIVDLHYSTPATAMAANNLVRCFLGAAAAALVNPLIHQVGCAWTYGAVSICIVGVSPLLYVIYAWEA